MSTQEEIKQHQDNATVAAFIGSFNVLQERVHAWAKAKGWWGNPIKDKARDIINKMTPEAFQAMDLEVIELIRSCDEMPARNDGELIALMTSELSEALEGLRHGNPPDDKVPNFTAEEAEYADTIIRIMDAAGAKNLRVAEAIIAKMAYNWSRPHKHGKQF